jgi:hypothetical protein
MLNIVAGDIPNISEALNGLDAARFCCPTFVERIRVAVWALEDGILAESFVNIEDQLPLNMVDLQNSLQDLTHSLVVAQIKISSFEQRVRSLKVVVPTDLSNAKEVTTALHLAVCGPQINWTLGNKAISSFASLTIISKAATVQTIQSQIFLFASIWETDSFITDIVKILKSGDIRLSHTLKILNKAIGQYEYDTTCSSTLLLDTLLGVLHEQKSTTTVQKEKLSVLLVTRYRCPEISNDSVGLINDFLYSHEGTISVVSSIMEILYSLSHSPSNKQTFINNTKLISTVVTFLGGFKNNRNICYYGGKILHEFFQAPTGLAYIDNVRNDLIGI